MTTDRAGLIYELGTTGEARTVASLGRVGAALARTGGAARTVAAGVGRAMGGLWRQISGLGGMIGLGLGAAGLTSMIRDVAAFDAELLALGHSAGLSAGRSAELGRQIGALATTTGRSRDELIAATGVAEDLGMAVDDIVAGLEDASNWARLLGVSLNATAPAMAGLRKIAPDVDARTRMAMADIAARKSGMGEEKFLGLVGAVAPRLAGTAGLEGAEGLQAMFEMIAATGESLDPAAIGKAIKAFTAAVRGGDLAKLGIETKDVGAAFRQFAAIGYDQAARLAAANLPATLDAFGAAAGRGSANAVRLAEELKAVDPAAFGRELEAAGKDPSARWAQFVETMKEKLRPLAEGALAWLVDHSDDLVAGFDTLLTMVLGLGSAIKATVDAIRGIVRGFIEFVAPFLPGMDQLLRMMDQVQGASGEVERALAWQPSEQARSVMAAATNPERIASARNAELMGSRRPGAINGPQINVFIEPSVAAQATVRSNARTTPVLGGLPSGAGS